jgi:hypothetical protein
VIGALSFTRSEEHQSILPINNFTAGRPPRLAEPLGAGIFYFLLEDHLYNSVPDSASSEASADVLVSCVLLIRLIQISSNGILEREDQP